jgi:hypothetical protein
MKSRPSKDQPIINENNTNVTQNVVEKDTLEDLDIKIKKLMRSQPSISIDFHAFKDEYGLSNEGINPHRIKNKDVQKVALKEMFGAVRRRSGYSFANCHNVQVVDRIKDIYPIVHGKTNLPKSKLIGKEFAKGNVVEMVKGKKVNWARFGHETNNNQRSKWLSWIEKCIEKKIFLLGKTI